MDLFPDAKVVRLKKVTTWSLFTPTGFYLTACEDENSVEIKELQIDDLIMSSEQINWTVEYPEEHDSKGKVFRLRSCFGKYLALVKQQKDESKTKWKLVQSNLDSNSSDVQYDWYFNITSPKSSRCLNVILSNMCGEQFYLAMDCGEVSVEEGGSYRRREHAKNEVHWLVDVVETSDKVGRGKGEEGGNDKQKVSKDCQTVSKESKSRYTFSTQLPTPRHFYLSSYKIEHELPREPRKSVTRPSEQVECCNLVRIDEEAYNGLESVSTMFPQSQLPPLEKSSEIVISYVQSGGNVNYSGQQTNGDIIYNVKNGNIHVYNSYYGNIHSNVPRKRC